LALVKNAAAVVFGHNHPSGNAWPSQEDRDITQKLVGFLKEIDVMVHDHIIVGNTNGYSMQEYHPEIFNPVESIFG